jgi:hypothetical protein
MDLTGGGREELCSALSDESERRLLHSELASEAVEVSHDYPVGLKSAGDGLVHAGVHDPVVIGLCPQGRPGLDVQRVTLWSSCILSSCKPASPSRG